MDLDPSRTAVPVRHSADGYRVDADSIRRLAVPKHMPGTLWGFWRVVSGLAARSRLGLKPDGPIPCDVVLWAYGERMDGMGCKIGGAPWGSDDLEQRLADETLRFVAQIDFSQSSDLLPGTGVTDRILQLYMRRFDGRFQASSDVVPVWLSAAQIRRPMEGYRKGPCQSGVLMRTWEDRGLEDAYWRECPEAGVFGPGVTKIGGIPIDHQDFVPAGDRCLCVVEWPQVTWDLGWPWINRKQCSASEQDAWRPVLEGLETITLCVVLGADGTARIRCSVDA